jgi:hypothetical protein
MLTNSGKIHRNHDKKNTEVVMVQQNACCDAETIRPDLRMPPDNVSRPTCLAFLAESW